MDLSDRMGGAVHLVFPDEKKGGRSQIGETECEKFQEMKKRNFNWNGGP